MKVGQLVTCVRGLGGLRADEILSQEAKEMRLQSGPYLLTLADMIESDLRCIGRYGGIIESEPIAFD